MNNHEETTRRLPDWFQWTAGLASILGLVTGVFVLIKSELVVFGASITISMAFVYFLLFILPRLSGRLAMSHLRFLFVAVQRSWPPPNADYHSHLRTGWRETLDLIPLNRESAWLLPPPSKVYIANHPLDYFRLQLAEWNRIVKDHADGNNPLTNARYLFITWDLRTLENYTPETILALSGMLNTLADKAQSSPPLSINRILVLDMHKWEQHPVVRRQFFLDIWLSYFEFVPAVYKFQILDGDSLSKLPAVAGCPDQLESFLDVAFFSPFEATAEQAEHELLPQVPGTRTYSHCQFSSMLHKSSRFTGLHLAQDRELIDRQLGHSRGILGVVSTHRECVVTDKIIEHSKKFFSENCDDAAAFVRETLASKRLKQDRKNLAESLPEEADLSAYLDKLRSEGISLKAAPSPTSG